MAKLKLKKNLSFVKVQKTVYRDVDSRSQEKQVLKKVQEVNAYDSFSLLKEKTLSELFSLIELNKENVTILFECQIHPLILSQKVLCDFQLEESYDNEVKDVNQFYSLIVNTIEKKNARGWVLSDDIELEMVA